MNETLLLAAILETGGFGARPKALRVAARVAHRLRA